MDPHKLERYSFIGSDPFLIIKSRGDSITVNSLYKKKEISGKPFGILGIVLKMYKYRRQSFTGALYRRCRGLPWL